MKRKPRKSDVDRATEQVREIRASLMTEADLLRQTYPERLVAYGLLTTAIRVAADSGLSADQFAQLAQDTIALYAGEEPHKDTPRVKLI
jgi:hypothetical protein